MSLKRRRSQSRGFQLAGNSFEVEEVIGYKLVANKLRFFVKWHGFDQTKNTWEPLENLEKCTVFQDYIKNKFTSLEKDIYVNVCNIKQRLKKRIRATMDQQKAITMHQIHPFDPFEFKIVQVFYHLLPPDENFRQSLEDLVFKNFFFKLDEVQRQQNDVLLDSIRKKEDIKVTIENDEDFNAPPKFEYITKNFLTDKMYVIELNKVSGCKCNDCSKDSDCCPKLMKQPFPYKVDAKGRTVLRLNRAEKIFECGDLCKCGPECINRLSQRRKEIPLCLYKTKNRGWGVKTMAPIPKGTFIIEYVGELIGQEEADQRAETAYLFDLNLDRRTDNRFYTIDAFQFGNLSRFINHSCEPNARIWFINNCHGDPKNQKLCFFSERFISKGEEITLDYTGGDLDRESYPTDVPIACNCGAASCRGIIY